MRQIPSASVRKAAQTPPLEMQDSGNWTGTSLSCSSSSPVIHGKDLVQAGEKPSISEGGGGKWRKTTAACSEAKSCVQTPTVTPVTAPACSIIPDFRPLAAKQQYTHCRNTYSNAERKHIVSIIMNHVITVWFAQSLTYILGQVPCSITYLRIRWLFARSVIHSLSNSDIETHTNTHRHSISTVSACRYKNK